MAQRGGEPLTLELVMVSHMDSDHIVGIKKLFSRLKREIENDAPMEDRTVRVDRLWLNVFNDILGDSIDAYYQKLTSKVQASVDGSPNPELIDKLEQQFKDKENSDDPEFDARSVAAVLASHGEGRSVRDDHQFLVEQRQSATLNSPFAAAAGKATLITLEKTKTPENVGDLKVTILGPTDTEIAALQVEFDKYIEEHGLTAESVLAAYADDSIKNLSSIVCLVEYKKKRILLTGDARGDLILAGLRKRKLLKDETIAVDILKVPHHGSDRNVEPEFFQKILADTYVLSGDGQYGNPERATLQWIADARGKTAKFDLVLTYDIALIDKNRKITFEKDQKRKQPAERRKWDHATMSLETFFAEKKKEKYAFTLQLGRRKIDLGDEKLQD